jgi:CheY-like chemotaxis protein
MPHRRFSSSSEIFVLLAETQIANVGMPAGVLLHPRIHEGRMMRRTEREGAMRRAVLVVEDEVGVRRAITRLLNDKGFSTIEAGNGREAIQRLSEETPLAIIIDLFMPVMSGVELLKALRRNTYYRRIPTVVVTGASTNEVYGVPTVIKPNIEGLPGLIEALVATNSAIPEAQPARTPSAALAASGAGGVAP